nr:MAG TPA: hypothetical protein [Caudoviricetes sp.]
MKNLDVRTSVERCRPTLHDKFALFLKKVGRKLGVPILFYIDNKTARNAKN